MKIVQLGLDDLSLESMTQSSSEIISLTPDNCSDTYSSSDTNEDDDEWMQNYPNNAGNLINDHGRIKVYEPLIDIGLPKFGRPQQDYDFFRYLPCYC